MDGIGSIVFESHRERIVPKNDWRKEKEKKNINNNNDDDDDDDDDDEKEKNGSVRRL